MQQSDAWRMLLLAAIWGASFPLMRTSVDSFGPLPIAMIRVMGGSLFLAPLLLMSKPLLSAAKANRGHIAAVGLFNSAIPFLCFSFAAASIPSGLASIFNSTTPLWGALFGRLWLGERLTSAQILGLAIGFGGVVYLATSSPRAASSSSQTSAWAVAACLTATACYGFSGIYTKKYLKGVPPLATATGSLFAAGAVLALPAIFYWPASMPAAKPWAAVALLAIGCTGLAFVIFYRLIDNVGPTIAMAVAYLIPLFANLWGWIFLGERPTGAIVIGCCLILTGTSLTTGIVQHLFRSDTPATLKTPRGLDD
jgi:drug/metabolite transporter (DMT)-like permease